MAEQDYPDHGRVLALLFRRKDEPSRRSGLTVGRIVDAAITIADDAGLGALSMRRIAEELGVGTMSLYTYVSSKAELVPVMMETVTGELKEIGPHDAGWRAKLEAMATGYWDLYEGHQWLLEVPVSRPLLGPNGYRRSEAELQAVDGIGLDEWEMAAVIEAVHTHTAGSARRALEILRDAEHSGMSDDQWWYSVSPLLGTYLASFDLPVAARVGTTIAAPHTDSRFDFEFGLARLLDGLGQLIEARDSGAEY